MFVGRDRQAEVHQLEDLFDKVRATAQPHLTVLSAPPGWGKTRVVQEFYRSLAARQPQPAYWPSTLVPSVDGRTSGFVALTAERKTVRHRDIEVPPDAHIPWLWLAPASGRLGDGSPAPVLDNLTNQISRHLPHLIRRLERRQLLVRSTYRLIGAALPLPDLLELAETVLDMGEELIQAHTEWRRERRRSRESRHIDYGDEIDRGAQVYELLRTLIQSGRGEESLPIVLVLDDAHNLDPAAVSLVENALASDLPLLAIATTWPDRLTASDEPFPRYLREASSSAQIRKVELDRLTDDDLIAYVMSLHPRTDPQIAARLAERADGNPYALRLLLDAPRLRALTREGRIALGADEVARLDGGLNSLLAQHWAELSLGVRQVLVAASLLGESFLDNVLVAGLGRVQSSEGLDAALASSWIRSTGNTTGTIEFVERLRFRIAKDNVEDTLSPEERTGILTGALSAVRTLLAEEDLSDGRRILLTLHITLAVAGIETDLRAAAASASEIADVMRSEHRRTEAIRYLQQAESWLAQAGRANSRERVQCLIDLSTVLRTEYGREDGEPAAEQALRIADEHLAEDDELRIFARCALAWARRRRAETTAYASATKLVEEAKSMLEKLPEASPSIIRAVLSVRAGLAASDGDNQAALALHRVVLAHCENEFGRLHRHTLGALEEVGYQSLRVGAVNDAVATRRQVLARRTELIGRLGQLQTTASRNNLAFTLLQLGDDRSLAEAEQLTSEAYEAWCRAYGAEGRPTQRARLVRSQLWLRQGLRAEVRGDQETAAKLFARAAEESGAVVELRRGRGPEPLTLALQRHGAALAGQRDPAAVPHFERALDLHQRELRRNRSFWVVRRCAAELHWAHLRLGRQAEAQAVARLYRLDENDAPFPL
ncbi:AAA family ATPase [Micromonospora sp. NPDC007271]|uniref:ATP-binding protein n=1 Tax=Micromonospora sp. NPDC007271 TaxID=3154587 RepID=UPI00340FB911